MSLQTCPICSGTPESWASKTTAHGVFEIVRCRACGYAFVDPRPDRASLVAYYGEGGREGGPPQSLEEVLESERAYPNSTVDAARIVATILRHGAAGRGRGLLLDVGCGYGFFSAEAARRGFTVSSLEIAGAERLVAEQLNGISPQAVTFEDFRGEPGSYGAIVMSQILEHAFDVNEWIRKAAGLLAPGGVIAVAVPNFGSLVRRVLRQNDPYVSPPDHLNYFSPHNLSALLERHGLATCETQWISRLPLETVQRRLPLPAGAARWLPVAPLLRLVDALRLGMAINVYARKDAGA